MYVCNFLKKNNFSFLEINTDLINVTLFTSSPKMTVRKKRKNMMYLNTLIN